MIVCNDRAYIPPAIDVVVKNDVCIGCGICAAVCPTSSLQVSFCSKGEYRPIDYGHCVGCNLCIKVCPFGPDNKNEDDLARELYSDQSAVARRPECGYYVSSYVGYAPAYRSKSASGGLATEPVPSAVES
ncbi:MAG: 4Fe-4S binding protein [Armatimonadota bacterium]